jgi:beta-lactamase class A VEB
MLLIVFGYINSNAQPDHLKIKINNLIKDKNATVGVSIIANRLKDTINVNESLRYPMQSVFKFPIALAVLTEVDKGKFKLNQLMKITSKDLLLDTWSPIRENFPNGTTIAIGEIIKYMVSESDNNGCDILLRLIGGTQAVEEFLLQNHLFDISIKANEEDMHKDWNVQFQNWATPVSLNRLLIGFYVAGSERMLSKGSYEFLWKTMTETSTGANRLRGQLPQNTIVAHKTGSSGTNDKNIRAAVNDIGIIVLPNGDPIFISVLITNSSETEATNEKIISDIAKIAWEYYSK